MKLTKLASVALVAALSMGSIAVVATSAAAAQPSGCGQTPGKPYKSGTQIKGTGSGNCTTSKSRTLNYQVHRSYGITNPQVFFVQDPGSQTTYSATGSTCDSGSGTDDFRYFGQVSFAGYEWTLSADSAELVICG